MSDPAAAGSAGLYLHVPFCARVCPYCDFAVTTGSAARRARFVAALAAEIELHAAEGWSFDTVYLGGGTPSALDPGQLETILGAARRSLDVAAGAVLHLEANPEDVTPAIAHDWRALGVRFLSLGVQSLDDSALRFLGRTHDAARARVAVAAARAAGLDTVSLDLIYGLPGDRPERWQSDLASAVALEPDHISCYQLTVSEGTPFAKQRRSGQLAEIGDALQADLIELTHACLEEHGYRAYEISNFARAPGHRSQHNRKYWNHLPYLGCGPSAHSFAGRRRWWNLRRLDDWQARIESGVLAVAGEEALSAGDLALEELMLGLRTTDGIDLAGFRARHGIDIVSRNRALLDRLDQDRLVVVTSERLVATRRGLAVADSLARSIDLC